MNPRTQGNNPARRRFLKAASALSVAGPVGAPFALSLAAMGAAQAQSVSDYRALVCVFLFGGNDSHNMVLATDPDSWAAYNAARSTAPDPIRLPPPDATGGVLPIVPATPQSGRTFALHPAMLASQSLFASGDLAIVPNVGPLVAPTTRVQYQSRSVPLPPSLFSHNDQQSVWQSFEPEGATIGWGGRIGDLVSSMNGNSTFTAISAAGRAVWLSGDQVFPYRVGTNGPTAIIGLSTTLFGSSTASGVLRSVLTGAGSNLFEMDYGTTVGRSIDGQVALSGAMASAAPLLPVPPAGNSLASQLHAVAQIIGGRSQLGARRQIFFVSLGGFDTHDGQNQVQATLLGRLDAALSYFSQAMAAINASNEVTLFTASDFGRTLTSNGDGTDHGWGSHHLVMGGAVAGGDLYGRYPLVGLDNADAVGQGRLLPSWSVDQYAATLGRWFGLTEAQLDDVFPGLVNFGSARDLGFMQSV